MHKKYKKENNRHKKKIYRKITKEVNYKNEIKIRKL